VEHLTRRELEVLKLLSEGYTNKGIAAALWIDVQTVKTHTSHILSKLEARNRAGAVGKGFRDGFLRG
jgi:DNA-binding NarL/FixJ family response regulator